MLTMGTISLKPASYEALLTDIVFCDSAYQTMEKADALVIVTEWNEFRSLDLGRVKSLMRDAVLVDLRNIYRPDEIVAAGFSYTSIGRKSVAPRRPKITLAAGS